LAVSLVGLGIAVELTTAAPEPPQTVIPCLVMTGMGGLVAWKKPDAFH
jgi:hypothetical protein